jgi:hypothetical protein
MKKFLFLSVAILAFVLGSCSKESKLNRKLDGKWDVVTFSGITPASVGITTFTIEFSKDKKGKGSYVSTSISSFGTDTSTGTYELTDDTKMTMTETPTAGNTSTPDAITINSYSKSDLTLSDSDGTVIVLKKK